MTLFYQKLNCCVACCLCERKANFDIATYIDGRNRCYLWDLVYVGRWPCPSASLSESRPAWLLLLIGPTLASGSHTAAGISGQELIVSLNWGQGHNKYAANRMHKRAGKVLFFSEKRAERYSMYVSVYCRYFQDRPTAELVNQSRCSHVILNGCLIK